jgi:MFS family permease
MRDGIVPAANGVAQTPEHDPVEPPSRNYRTVALIIACAMFMENLDATVLATALPTMARDFGVRAPEMSIALTSYLLALAVFIPASGTMADRYGAKLVFRLAIVLFMCGSLACGLSPTLPMMAAARFVQGIGPIVGPPVGGFIVTYLDWRWIFWLNLPIGVLGVILVGRFIADIRETDAHPFDPVGFLLSGVALGCLLFGFEMASRAGGGVVAAPLIGIGLVAGWFYLRHARRVAHPILDLSLLRVPTFRLSVMGGSLTRITQGAQPFLLPLMMQIGFGMSAAQSGLITVATAIGSFGMKGVARRILRRFGFRSSLIVIGVLSACSYALCGLFRPDWPVAAMFAVLVVSGFLMSFQFTAYNTIAYDQIDKRRMSVATSFYATFQQLMLSLGICVAALVLHLSMLARGHVRPAFPDFTTAFLAVTAISLTALFVNRRFAPDAGAEMSGRQ